MDPLYSLRTPVHPLSGIIAPVHRISGMRIPVYPIFRHENTCAPPFFGMRTPVHPLPRMKTPLDPFPGLITAVGLSSWIKQYIAPLNRANLFSDPWTQTYFRAPRGGYRERTLFLPDPLGYVIHLSPERCCFKSVSSVYCWNLRSKVLYAKYYSFFF